ncbi:MAG: DUF1517 domain-containing protein [Myxococcales bacterium]|nr:DUF1517 domain-containing protein [Myxococcales bacterium]
MRKTRWWALLALVLSAWLLGPSGASAWPVGGSAREVSPVLLGQHTGGSFGGSRWGSGSSPSRPSSGSSRPSYGGGSYGSRPSYGGSYGSRPSYGGSSYGGTSYGGTGYGSSRSSGGFGLVCGVLFLIIIVAIVISRSKSSAPTVSYTPGAAPMGGYGGGGYGGQPHESFSLAALAIAFDSRVRAQVQGEMDRISAQVNFNAPDGLNQAARMVAETLSRFLDGAYLTHHALSQGMPMQAAQQQFQQAVDTERGRFIVETVRADQGGVRKVNAPSSQGSAEEGGGFVVVTVIVCKRDGLPNFRPIAGRGDLVHDLQVMLNSPGALQAMEVVWQPADPNDVMSSAEMATVFPTLKPLSPDARVGRRACGHCKTVYAAELPQCPNCGAPSQ